MLCYPVNLYLIVFLSKKKKKKGNMNQLCFGGKKAEAAAVLVQFGASGHTEALMHNTNTLLPHTRPIRRSLTQTIGQWMCLPCSGALSSVQAFSLCSHTQTAKTNTINYSRLQFWLVVFFNFFFFFPYYFDSVASVTSSGSLNSWEARWVNCEAWWLEVCVCLCNLDGRV